MANQVHNDILNNIMLYMTLFKTTFNDAYYMDYKTFRAILNLRIDMENKKEKLQKELINKETRSMESKKQLGINKSPSSAVNL